MLETLPRGTCTTSMRVSQDLQAAAARQHGGCERDDDTTYPERLRFTRGDTVVVASRGVQEQECRSRSDTHYIVRIHAEK